VLRVEAWTRIRYLHAAEGTPIRAICRELGISRNTVPRIALIARRSTSEQPSQTPIRAICRELGVSRQHSARKLRGDRPPKYERAARPNPKLAAFEAQIRAWHFSEKLIRISGGHWIGLGCCGP
jgi:hypothetical protein